MATLFMSSLHGLWQPLLLQALEASWFYFQLVGAQKFVVALQLLVRTFFSMHVVCACVWQEWACAGKSCSFFLALYWCRQCVVPKAWLHHWIMRTAMACLLLLAAVSWKDNVATFWFSGKALQVVEWERASPGKLLFLWQFGKHQSLWQKPKAFTKSILQNWTVGATEIVV